MEATQTLEHWFEQADQSLPVLTQTGRWVVFGVGAVLWLLGGKVLKPAAILGGLALGMILGGLSMMFVESAGVVVGFMVGLGLLGALAAWLVFRAWVALAMALVFAVAAPAGVLIWQGVPAGELAQDTEQAAVQVERQYDQMVGQLNDQTKLEVQSLIERGDEASLKQADSILKEQGSKAFKAAREIVFRNLEDINTWWQSRQPGDLRTIGLAMLIGGGVGLLLGLLFPSHAVVLQSAMVGAVLMVVPGRELLVSQFDSAGQWAPTDTRGTLVTIGLITAVGLILQWTLYLRRDDKRA